MKEQEQKELQKFVSALKPSFLKNGQNWYNIHDSSFLKPYYTLKSFKSEGVAPEGLKLQLTLDVKGRKNRKKETTVPIQISISFRRKNNFENWTTALCRYVFGLPLASPPEGQTYILSKAVCKILCT